LLGIGCAGLFDAIVLHLILQWHHMVCTVAGCNFTSVNQLRAQLVNDGWFAAGSFATLLLGVVFLFAGMNSSGDRVPTGRLLGAILAGFGAFNVAEGILDHHVLRVHHVRPGPDELMWDLGFLAVNALLLVLGVRQYRRSFRSAWRRR